MGKKNHKKITKSEPEKGQALDSSDFVEVDYKYSKRKLETNWQKYEDDHDLGNEAKALDFSQFSAAPSTSGGSSHFRFANEKDWQVCSKVSDYFQLDVKSLHAEILAVPLHLRLKLDEQLFSREQILSFEKEAKLVQNSIKEDVLETQKIGQKIVTLLSNRADTSPERSGAGPQPQSEDSWNNDYENTDNSGANCWQESANSFSLCGLDQELDAILSMPLTSASGNSERHHGPTAAITADLLLYLQ